MIKVSLQQFYDDTIRLVPIWLRFKQIVLLYCTLCDLYLKHALIAEKCHCLQIISRFIFKFGTKFQKQLTSATRSLHVLFGIAMCVMNC